MWNFNSLFGVCLIFYIRFCELQKASGITPWKNATRYCAGPAYCRMCSADVLQFQNKPAAIAPEAITHHFFVSGIGQKKTVDAAKICGGAENVVKTETQQTFVNGCSVLLLWAFMLAGAQCMLYTSNCMSCPSCGQLYLHCSLICFWVPSSCFCIVISLSLRVK